MHRDPTVDCVEGELGSFQYVDSGVLDLGVILEAKNDYEPKKLPDAGVELSARVG